MYETQQQKWKEVETVVVKELNYKSVKAFCRRCEIHPNGLKSAVMGLNDGKTVKNAVTKVVGGALDHLFDQSKNGWKVGK